MKKILFAAILGILFVAALATTVMADNGPHGGFTATTDACASCHRAHTARSADGYLLVASDVEALCFSCHDGTGAYTNVVDGYYDNTTAKDPTFNNGPLQGDPGEPLFGGGFVNTRAMHTWTGKNAYDATVTLTAAPVTSTHDVSGTATGTVWGSGDINTGNGGTLAGGATLECTSCHDPHGNAGRTGGVHTGAPTASYRILRFQPVGSNGFETTGPSAAYFVSAGVTESGTLGGVYIADVATKWYTPNTNVTIDPSVAAYRSRYDSAAGAQTPYQAYIQGLGDWAGRTYVYQRPAFQAGRTGNNPNYTYISCPDPVTGLPTGPNTPPTNGTDAGFNTTACGANLPAGSIWNNTAPMQKLGLWCATCHDRYLATNARTTDSGDATFMFRHTSSGGGVGSCVVCHAAHGTSAAMTTNLAQNATLNPGSSDLLKYDNRSICADCHGTSVNFWTNPSDVVYP